ncbi:unnamed protein product [Blepharisma stoltei]|uniref:Uncharacterized protein n=1 Tax=Blepharisma stoltei TaxID=1481888 RepID=A0AAU9J6X2_9CILI|nr:unnamed protein product [Blepharisma stoltei]
MLFPLISEYKTSHDQINKNKMDPHFYNYYNNDLQPAKKGLISISLSFIALFLAAVCLIVVVLSVISDDTDKDLFELLLMLYFVPILILGLGGLITIPCSWFIYLYYALLKLGVFYSLIGISFSAYMLVSILSENGHIEYWEAMTLSVLTGFSVTTYALISKATKLVIKILENSKENKNNNYGTQLIDGSHMIRNQYFSAQGMAYGGNSQVYNQRYYP